MGNLRHRINGTCSVCYFCKEKLELIKCYVKVFWMTKTLLIQLVLYMILSMTTKPLQSIWPWTWKDLESLTWDLDLSYQKAKWFHILQFKSSEKGYCWLKNWQGNYMYITVVSLIIVSINFHGFSENHCFKDM